MRENRFRRLALGLLLALAFIAAGVVVVNVGRWVRSRRFGASCPDGPFALDARGGIPADDRPLDSARVAEALGKVRDPELEFSIAELGLIRRIGIDSAGGVAVEMILTTRECPLSQDLANDVLAALAAIPGVGRVQVTVDPTQVWDPSHLSGAAREAYRRFFHRNP